jgi:hypothetical protein
VLSGALNGTVRAATFTVTSTADSGNGSLRQAILSANLSAGTDSIRFTVGGAGVVNIIPRTELPALTGPVIIDGATQPGFAGTPLIRILGTNLSTAGSGLRVLGGGSTVRALWISGFAVAGLRLETAGSNVVVGNILGHAGTPDAPESNGLGLYLGTNCSNNTIGGTDASDRNIVSGNRAAGLLLSAGASGNVVQGNWIGLANESASANGNGGAGIVLSNALRTTIGGTETQAGNVICGNLSDGVHVAGNDSREQVIQGNVIGLNAAGAAAPNQRHGVYLEGYKVTLGGVEPGAGNVVSGNRGAGVWLAGGEHVVQGNRIGTTQDGLTGAPNGHGPDRQAGLVAFGTNHTIGGSADGRNIISGNAGAGLRLVGSGVDVKGNFIGVDRTGLHALPNGADGVRIEAGSHSVGGDTSDDRNVVAGNLGNGIALVGGSAPPTENSVRGNYLGVGSDGAASLGNGLFGLMLSEGVAVTWIGGAARGEGNVISGNQRGGILLAQNVSLSFVQGNQIGTAADGILPVPNLGHGIRVESGAVTNLLGGGAEGEGNVIAHNVGAGVSVSGASTVGNSILRNRFSTNGGLGIDLERPGEFPARTLNDALDADAGPNGLQNFPIITNVTKVEGLIAVQGTLRSKPDRTFSLELYGSAASNPSGYGEGEEYLGTAAVDTDETGVASFLFLLDGEFNGRVFTMTATDVESGDTSEFGPAFVNASAAPAVQVTDVTVAEPQGTGAAQFRVELSTPTASLVSVRFATAPGTALDGLDYLGTNGLLRFEPGEKEQVVPVIVLGDFISEADEQFFLNLTQPVNASLGRARGSATVFDFVITGVQRTSQVVDVSFTTSLNRLYHLERAEQLQPAFDTIWRAVPGAGALPGTGAIVTARDTNVLGTASACYRVVAREAGR